MPQDSIPDDWMLLDQFELSVGQRQLAINRAGEFGHTIAVTAIVSVGREHHSSRAHQAGFKRAELPLTHISTVTRIAESF